MKKSRWYEDITYGREGREIDELRWGLFGGSKKVEGRSRMWPRLRVGRRSLMREAEGRPSHGSGRQMGGKHSCSRATGRWGLPCKPPMMLPLAKISVTGRLT